MRPNSFLWLLLAVPSYTSPQQLTERVSVATLGVQADGASLRPVISHDGNYVAFDSVATNLVPSDTNSLRDVFIRDRLAGTTTRVSRGLAGAQPNGASSAASISADGGIIAFESSATNLVSGDSNGLTDVFFFELATGITRRASVSSAGVQANATSSQAAVSANGQFVAFYSNASNLAAPNGAGVYLRDVIAGTTTFVSVGARPAISGDGRFLALERQYGFSTAVFRHDMTTGTSTPLTVLPPGAIWFSDLIANAGISADGRLVTFDTAAFAYPGELGFPSHAWTYDCDASLATRVSVDWEGLPGNATSSHARIAPDGDFVAFESLASNLIQGDMAFTSDIFVRDLDQQFTFRISGPSAGGQANGASSRPSISTVGLFVAFQSDATNLVAGDSNGVTDIFVADVRRHSVATYCTAGISASGCVPSISATGLASSTAGSGFQITIGGVDGERYGTIFYGMQATSFLWAPASLSFRCVRFPLQRTPVQDSGGTTGMCDGQFSLDFNAWRAANPGALGNPFVAGQVFHAQGWFRDPGAPKQTNLSDGLRFTLCD